MPKQKRAQGRQKKNWMEGIMKAMNERNLNEGQWEDRKKWSPGVGQRRTIRSLYLKPARVHACIYLCVCVCVCMRPCVCVCVCSYPGWQGAKWRNFA